jgi:hypothetical protein
VFASDPKRSLPANGDCYYSTCTAICEKRIMNWNAIGVVGEIVGAVAVVVSLIYALIVCAPGSCFRTLLSATYSNSIQVVLSSV